MKTDTIDDGKCIYEKVDSGLKLVVCYYKEITRYKPKTDTIEIADYAFKGCKKMSGITLPENLIKIGKGAFLDTRLKELYIPGSVKEIGDNLDYLVGNISKKGNWGNYYVSTKIIFSESNASYASVSSYYGTGIIENIGDEKILRSVGKIRPNGIKDTYSLEQIDITRIDDNAFKGYSKVEKIILPKTLKTIGDNAFCDCTKLKSIIIPENVEKIGKSAFCNCSSLENVEILSNKVVIDDDIFAGCNIKKMKIFGTNGSTAGEFAKKHGINFITAGDNNINAKFVFTETKKGIRISEYLGNDVVLEIPEEINEKPIIGFSQKVFKNNTNLVEVNILADVKELPKELFSGCTHLLSVKLPESLKKIDDRVFYNAYIKEITIPESVEWFGSDIFKNLRKSNDRYFDTTWEEYVSLKTIIGKIDSPAEDYAVENGVDFKPL